MPRSHICPSCLTELARIRAVPDPHYGLPIVVCPGCRLASVRTRHPDQMFWRETRQLWKTLFWFALRLVMIAGAVFAMMITVFATGYNLAGGRWGDRRLNEIDSFDTQEWFFVFVVVGFSFLAGLLIRIALSHRSAAYSLCVLAILEIIWIYLFDGVQAMHNYVTYANTTWVYSETLIFNNQDMLVLCFAAAIVLASLGAAVGSVILRAIQRTRKDPIHRLLSKHRKRICKHD